MAVHRCRQVFSFIHKSHYRAFVSSICVTDQSFIKSTSTMSIVMPNEPMSIGDLLQGTSYRQVVESVESSLRFQPCSSALALPAELLHTSPLSMKRTKLNHSSNGAL
uniref:Uncharacterized protein n=1 Tax=Plectus sambesii TaxID=2011161 RepID=A0A914X7Z1_9BILA